MDDVHNVSHFCSSISIVLRKDGMFTTNPQYDLTLKKTKDVLNKDGTYVSSQNVEMDHVVMSMHISTLQIEYLCITVYRPECNA